jgi:23S rRNA-intervening sequence protein
VKHSFNHENLDCYRLSLDVAQWVYKARFPRECQDLRDQLLRASRSIALNPRHDAEG